MYSLSTALTVLVHTTVFDKLDTLGIYFLYVWGRGDFSRPFNRFYLGRLKPPLPYVFCTLYELLER